MPQLAAQSSVVEAGSLWSEPCTLAFDVDAGIAPALLECLEAAYRMRQEGRPVSPAALGKRLGVGEPVVSEKLLTLQGLGLIEPRHDDRVAFTAEGERIALGLIRKHRLLERFCADVLGLAWEEVHEEACRLTPACSDRVGDALAKLLGEPAACPHGNPIPSADGALRVEPAVPLSQLRPGQAGVIVRIEREDPALLKYLASLGLLPRTRVEVEEVAPLRGPILVQLGTSRYALGRKVASKILVRRT